MPVYQLREEAVYRTLKLTLSSFMIIPRNRLRVEHRRYLSIQVARGTASLLS